MTTVRDVMTTDPVVIETTTPVREAAQRMRDEDCGAVLVEEGGNLRGIVTDRDITVRCTAEGIDPESATVEPLLSEDLYTLAPDDSLGSAVAMMRDHAVRRVPVIEDGTAVGILSIGDLAVIREPESVIADISAAPGNA